MAKKFITLSILLFLYTTSFSQVITYRIGKYKAVVNLTKFTMKWEKGKTTATLLEIQTDERNVRKFNEIENGRVSGTFEIYEITDGQTEGVYTRADGKQFNMKIIGYRKQ